MITMAKKITCPVCRENSIRPLMQDVQFCATVGGTSCSVVGFLGFRCGKGHLFFVMSDEADCLQTEKGSGLIV